MRNDAGDTDPVALIPLHPARIKMRGERIAAISRLNFFLDRTLASIDLVKLFATHYCQAQ